MSVSVRKRSSMEGFRGMLRMPAIFLGRGGVLDLVSLAMFDYIWCFLFLVCSIFQVAMGKLVSLQRAVTGWRIEARRLKL